MRSNKKEKGSGGGHNGEGQFREAALLQLGTLLPSVQVHNVDIHSIYRSGGGGGGYKRLGRLTVQSYITSRLCLVPSGDTPITRRLYEALAAGIPLYVIDIYKYLDIYTQTNKEQLTYK